MKRLMPFIFVLLFGLGLAHADDPLRTVQANDPLVRVDGAWHTQPNPAASSSSLLISSGSRDDVLTLHFTGPYVEIIYATGPALGALAVEIDQAVVRTVFTHSEQPQLGARTVIDYLDDGPHVLRVYSSDGPLAIDAFVAAVMVPPSGNDWYVAPGGDDDHDCLSATTACATIVTAIGKAHDGDTIHITTGTYAEALTVDKDLTLVGQGTVVLDGAGLEAPTITVTSTAQLRDLTLGGNTTHRAIISTGELRLENVAVVGNRGGMSAGRGSASVIDCRFEDNDAGRGNGGAVLVQAATVDISGSFFGGNHAFEGGALYISHSPGASTITDSVFVGNRATWGGAIHIAPNGGAELLDLTIVGNHAERAGGGLDAVGHTSLESSIIVGNQSATGVGPDCDHRPISAGHNLSGHDGADTGCLLDAPSDRLLTAETALDLRAFEEWIVP